MKMQVNVTLANVEAVRQARDDVLEKIGDLDRAMRTFIEAISYMDVEISQPTDGAAD